MSNPEPIKWTRELERELQRMRATLSDYEASRSQAIGAVAVAAGVSVDMAAIMIDKADAIRDALAPFDSGVRSAQQRQQAQEGHTNG